MSNPFNIPQQLHYGKGVQLLDPGNAGHIVVNRNPCCVNLVSAGAETRTLARPTRVGVLLSLFVQTYVGNITLTITGGYDINGDTTYTFSAAGQYLILESGFDGTNHFWMLVGSDSMGNLASSGLTLTELGYLHGAVAGAPAASKVIVLDSSGNFTESGNSQIVTTTLPVTAAMSGKTFFLTLANGFTSTLPAPALGLRYRFIVATAPTTAYIITTNASANILYGMMEERAGGAGLAGAAKNTFNFVANQAIIADWVEFYSDGTNWYYHGMVNVIAGNTVA